jgi:secreted trypsin-like serine protease
MPVRRLSIVALILAAFSAVPSADAEIVGGRPATRDYPFMASLQRAPSGSHRCGASLVHASWVLTAAHCVSGLEAEDLQIMIGSQKQSQPGDVIPLAEIRIHPEYTGGGYDVALLRLARPATQTPTRIASLSEQGLWAPGETATALGWGRNQYIVGSSPDQLHEVEVPVVSDADCARSYTGQGFDPTTEVCAGELTGGRDTCQGDSGGPLMVPDAQGQFIVFGTTSWGLGCAFPVFYGVYGEAGGPVLQPWLESQLPAA